VSAAPDREPDGLDRLRASGAVAIMRLRDHALSVDIAHALAGAGVRAIEVTLDHPRALDALGAVAAAMPGEVLLGAGTVRTLEQVRQAADAGARFCLSPHVDPAVVEATLAAGLEPVPGACTPTEVALSLTAGARLVKLFPAGPLGPGYLRTLLAPFAGVAFLPTGGIGHDAIAPWLDAGALAVGLGSDLVPGVPTGADLPGIAERARRVVAQVADVRG
jgi:Entner-Doudoroff aldolase